MDIYDQAAKCIDEKMLTNGRRTSIFIQFCDTVVLWESTASAVEEPPNKSEVAGLRGTGGIMEL